MRKYCLKIAVVIVSAMVAMNVHGQTTSSLCGPVPTVNQLRWQDMEMYAFIHYSLNTYTDQEWGFGNDGNKDYHLQFSLTLTSEDERHE